ncbi:DUF3263 domain-containing protein [Streptomyces sp. NPDC050610]|uniref:DUF3263 domain-containing protein n=1 Tax=Streptomyces sp. NPDC050610 TaxID=3157097 RepID=UPI0034396439
MSPREEFSEAPGESGKPEEPEEALPEPPERPGTAEPSQRPEPADPPSPRPELSDRELAVLAMERRSWAGPGAKERAIRERLGITPTRYYQLLNALLDDERALIHDPGTVNRLRRVRTARRERR